MYIVTDSIKGRAKIRCKDKPYRGEASLLPSWTVDQIVYDIKQVYKTLRLPTPKRVVVLEVFPGGLMDGVRGPPRAPAA